ncbi:OLC1v1021785C1 [Oldenlandia corymbosa var. corymbosa]|uniref:OLC1v1021785C1 n=1 Tax=Oldenlandia corymbosa var. corymbosa TaxID=529605 RepID=A0AAV1BWE4_OLDCO|nr:OLC1v1021785C1 [Oldenlandia corymbosa var. corymbosa]
MAAMTTATAAHHHPSTELDSGTADSLSVASTPRSIHPNGVHDDSNPPAPVPAAPTQRVRFMCSFGGKILPRPHDNQLRYIGGDTRIVAVNRHTTFSALISKLSKLCGTPNISIKYQLPNEDLDSLITVTTDEDVENMMDEYERLVQTQKSARLRIFLFSTDADSRTSSISSLLDGSTKREHWFLDALNGGSGRGPGLERGQSEVSSIVSEVPDYLFGLDNSDDAPREPKLRNTIKSHLSENHPGSDPGSPNPVVSSPFHSTSSSLAPPPSVPAIPDLPPVKTKPVNSAPVTESGKETPVEGVPEAGENQTVVSQQNGYASSPMWHYPGPAMQPVPVYYYPARPGNLPVQQVPMGAQYVQQIPVHSGQVYSHQVSGMGQVYGGGRPMAAVDPISGRVLTEGVNQPIYYNVRNGGMVQNYPGMVVSGAEEIQGPGGDGKMGRISQS